MRKSRRSKILNSKANEGALKNLSRVLQRESPLALVGAGMSISAGFPSWTSLVDDMDNTLGSLDNEYRAVLRTDTDLLWRAGEYRQMMGDKKFHGLMKSTFGKKFNVAPNDPTVAFARLPFRHFITTNYDDVIQHAHKHAGQNAPRLLNWFIEEDVRDFIFALRDKDSPRSVLHLHGHHSRPESIILSDEDYTERYVRTFGTANKLFAIFSTERVVFSGFSLNDPDLMALMREVNATMRPKEARHFAIMGILNPKNEILERNRLRNRFGVEPVFYNASGDDHGGLLEIIDELYNEFKGEQKPSPKYKTMDSVETKAVTVLRKADIDPDDPENGQWGGLAKANGREITAKVEELEPDWFRVTMTVRSTNSRQPLRGDVIFHLHPTLIPKVRAVEAVDGVAELIVESYGAYTVGVETDGRKNHLELDLSTIKSAPMMFRLN